MSNTFMINKNFLSTTGTVDLLTANDEDKSIDCRINDNTNINVKFTCNTPASCSDGDIIQLVLNESNLANITLTGSEANFIIEKNLFITHLIDVSTNQLQFKNSTKGSILDTIKFNVDMRLPIITSNDDGNLTTKDLPWGKELEKTEIKDGNINIKVKNAMDGTLTFIIKKTYSDEQVKKVEESPINKNEYPFSVPANVLEKLHDNVFYDVVFILKNKHNCEVKKNITFFVNLTTEIPYNYKNMINKISNKQKDSLGNEILPSQIQQLIYKNLIQLDFGSEFSLKPISNKTFGVGSIALRNVAPSNRYDFHIGRKMNSNMSTSVLVNDFIKILGNPFKNDNWAFDDVKTSDGNTITKEQINQNTIKKYMSSYGILGDKSKFKIDFEDPDKWKENENTMFKIIENTQNDTMKEAYNDVVIEIRIQSIKTFLSFFSLTDSIKRRFFKGGKTRKKSKRKSVRKTRSKK